MSTNKWLNLTAIPCNPDKWYQKNTWLIPTVASGKYLIVIHQQDGIWQYNFKMNQWYIIQNTDSLSFFKNGSNVAATFDDVTKLIYVCNNNGSIESLQLTTNKYQFHSISNISDYIRDFGSGQQIICINNQLHIIGGNFNNKHFKYNPNSLTVDTLHTFDECSSGFIDHQIVLVKNSLFMFGGYDSYHSTVLDIIHQYDIKSNQWHRLNVRMPKALFAFGCVSVINDNFILIFGGIDKDYKRCSSIYIYSLLTQQFTVSKIRCLKKGRVKAITIKDKDNDEKIVFGFVRTSWKLCNISDHLFPPEYLLRLIHAFYLQEFVHLIHYFSGKHWKISVFDIIVNDSHINT
eukprot:285078_1